MEVVSEKTMNGAVKTYNRYFKDYRTARAFAKEYGTKILRVEDSKIAMSKGQYLVVYQKVE